MRQKFGFTMLEILVASVILTLMVSAAMATYVSIKQLSQAMGYHYTAWNLAKEVLEFGEAGNFTHRFAMKYYYPGATINTIPAQFGGDPTYDNTSQTTGYAVKEWRYFILSNADPFDYMGNINTRGLVPRDAPNSVSISYYVEKLGLIRSLDGKPNTDYTNNVHAYIESVVVKWQNEVGAEYKTIWASVIPIRQINYELRLNTADFEWE